MIVIYFLLLFQNYSENDYIAEILKTKDISKIETIYNEANNKFPDSYNLNLNTAYKYLLLKKHNKAYILYKKSYKIYPSIDSLLGLTYTQLELNKYKELLKITSTYKYKKTENEKYIYSRRSYAYIMLERYNKAIKEADKGLENYPDFENLIKNKKYAKFMKPAFSINFIPIWGMINYNKSHPNRISYNYFGATTYSKYGFYNMDIGYINGKIEDILEVRTEHNLDFGLGYNKNYNIYFHLKKIFLTDENAIIPYIHLGYNFKNISLITAFSISSYEYLNNLIYQGSIYSYFYLFNRKFIPSLGIGYKFLKRDKTNSAPYFQAGFDLYFIDEIGIRASFRYNQHNFLVDIGGIVDNSLDDIKWVAEAGLNLKYNNFIISPIYRYYSINIPSTGGRRNNLQTSSKSFFTIILGYKF